MLCLLQPALDGDEMMDEAKMEHIREALNKIRGDNHESHVHPTDEELAGDARSILEGFLDDCPTNHVIQMERCSLYALEMCESDWLHGVLATQNQQWISFPMTLGHSVS